MIGHEMTDEQRQRLIDLVILGPSSVQIIGEDGVSYPVSDVMLETLESMDSDPRRVVIIMIDSSRGS